MSAPPAYETRPLDESTWNAFAALVEANNGVWGGCWCVGFHADGFAGSPEANRERKLAHVRAGTVHQVLVLDGEECVGWCQYGRPAELPNIKNAKVYARETATPPDWRIGCIFTGSGRRRRGVARAAVTGALDAIAAAGGGVVEAYPEQLEDRRPQQGSWLHTGPDTLYADLGFERVRRIAKWRWVMRLEVPARGGDD